MDSQGPEAYKSIPEIRIRKGSDAPSMGEIRGTAPLASADSEGLSEGQSEVESVVDTDNEAFSSDRETSPGPEDTYKDTNVATSDGDDITLHGQEMDERKNDIFLQDSKYSEEVAYDDQTPLASPTKKVSGLPFDSTNEEIKPSAVDDDSVNIVFASDTKTCSKLTERDEPDQKNEQQNESNEADDTYCEHQIPEQLTSNLTSTSNQDHIPDCYESSYAASGLPGSEYQSEFKVREDGNEAEVSNPIQDHSISKSDYDAGADCASYQDDEHQMPKSPYLYDHDTPQGYEQFENYDAPQGYEQSEKYDVPQGYEQLDNYDAPLGYDQSENYDISQGYDQSEHYGSPHGCEQSEHYDAQQVYDQRENYLAVEGYQYQQDNNDEGGDDPFDLTYIQQKYNKDTLETNSVERPRSTSPINLATLDDYSRLSTNEATAPEKIKISLPGSEFKSKGSNRSDDRQDLVSLSKSKGPIRPPPPGAKKPGRPPPPGRPQRPPQPSQADDSQWESFDTSTKSPSRPPPPRKSPSRPAPPRRGDGEAPAVTKEAAEDEATILDSLSGEKGKKSNKIKPGKAIKVLVHGKDYKEKKEKKEKARQQQRDLMSKYIKDDKNVPADKQNSEEWRKYQELLGKSDHDVESSKEKLSQMEAGFEGEMSKLWGMPVSSKTSKSPWQEGQQDSVMDAPIDESHPPKVGWVGFEDDFNSSGAAAEGKETETESSARDRPGSATKSPSGEQSTQMGDLLGLDSEDANQETEPTQNITLNDDIANLGLSDDIDAAPARDPAAESSGLNLVDDFLGISSSNDDSSAPKVLKDPLEQLKAMKKGTAPEDTAENHTTDPTQATADPSGEDLDDMFGFGGGGASNIPKDNSIKGDLFDLGADDTKPEDPFTVDLEKIQKEAEDKTEEDTPKSPTGSDDFDPRADIDVEKLDVKPVKESIPDWTSPRSAKRERPRPKKAVATHENPFTSSLPTPLLAKPGEPPVVPANQVPNPFADLVGDSETPVAADNGTVGAKDAPGSNTMDSELLDLGFDMSAAKPSANTVSGGEANADSGVDLLGGTSAEADDSANFNPFETITDEDEEAVSPAKDESFDPFATISGDDAFVATFPEDSGQEQASGQEQTSGDAGSREISPARFNPFNKEPPLDEKFANFEAKATREVKSETRASVDSPRAVTSESSFTEEEEDLEPLEPYYKPFTGDGWNLFVRLPTGGKKKITQNRYWKPVYVRLLMKDDNPCLKIFNNEKTPEVMQELTLQPNYNLCNTGLQQYDQFGKCHTVKIEQVVYRERMGVNTERIAPTLSDITRVRDFRGLKNLVHKPKATMILDHAPQRQELFKFGSLVHEDILTFSRSIEDAFFHMKIDRTKTSSYTKDEITVEVVDEYHVDIDKDGHITSNKARVRLYAISFLSGIPMVEVGVNDKRRRGKEVVGRHDIIPIKTEEWVKTEQPEMHYSVDVDEFEKNKVVKFRPIDAARYEIFRFRVRPRINKELPLQVRTVQTLIDRHYEIKCEVLIPGYHSNSRRAAQTPCEDIEIHFPIPEPWIYYFRVEKHFRYGSLHSTTRKPGKIKGLERLTMIAKGILPPNLIEVSTGMAKYEHLFRAIVWRIPRLPEKNEGAYKTHLMLLRLDLGPHDPIPTDFSHKSHVSFSMPNSTVSRAQVRSISINNPADDPPDRWVRHLAKYTYDVEMEWCDTEKKSQWEETEDERAEGAAAAEGAGALESEHSRDGDIDESSDSSDSD